MTLTPGRNSLPATTRPSTCSAGYATLIVTAPSKPIPGERADLATKLEDYTLNPLHPSGKHKAKVFESALGITRSNAHALRDAVLGAAVASEEVESRGDNGFGDVFVLRFPLTTEKGTATVLTGWIVRHGEDFPRLTTCYIV